MVAASDLDATPSTNKPSSRVVPTPLGSNLDRQNVLESGSVPPVGDLDARASVTRSAVQRGGLGDSITVLTDDHEPLQQHEPMPLLSQQDTLSMFMSEGQNHEGSWPRGFGEDLDLLWSDYDFNNPPLFPSSFPTGFAMNLVSLSHPEMGDVDFDRSGPPDATHTTGTEPVVPDSPHSRFPSRLPSVASIDGDNPNPSSTRRRSPHEPRPNATDESFQQSGQKPRAHVPWCLSRQDHDLMTASLAVFRPVLGAEFEMPSRYAMCRYVEGYFTGFHEHLPFIHRQTIDIATEQPELILAIAAVGARYRFQWRQSHELYIAARAAIQHAQHQRYGDISPPSSHDNPAFLNDGCSLPGGTPTNSNCSARRDTQVSPDQSYRLRIQNMKTMQAMILLIALGTWNHPHLLRDAFSMASQLALMVQEDGLSTADTHAPGLSWHDWIYAEGRRRTKIVAYCFMNLHTIVYNTSPRLLNQEIGTLNIPSPESHWRAANEEEWNEARKTDAHVEATIRNELDSLFVADADSSAHEHTSHHTTSSFGNYILIHCIVQQIFFLRCSALTPGSGSTSLPTHISLRLEQALRAWQKRWEATKDSSLDPSAPDGPLSFNSTALFRLAYIRICADFGPSRQLEIRDETTIARVFQNAPLLDRTNSARRTALLCAHALSIPVRIGIEYVARTQTLNWSILHSIGHLECALFLCTWLQTLAHVCRRGLPLEAGEKRLLSIVTSILSETDFSASIQRETDEPRRMQRMCVAIFTLWALTFKGAHVFDIMRTIGKGLDLCADGLRQELDAL